MACAKMVVYIRTNHNYYSSIYQKNRDNSIFLSYRYFNPKKIKIMLDFYYLIFMNQNFYEGIKNILTTARNKVYQTANFAMVEAYWNIGKSIIEEQGGNEKAEYGTGLLKELSKQMTQDFGKGFTVANLKNMRQFYLTFRIIKAGRKISCL